MDPLWVLWALCFFFIEFTEKLTFIFEIVVFSTFKIFGYLKAYFYYFEMCNISKK